MPRSRWTSFVADPSEPRLRVEHDATQAYAQLYD